MTRKSWNPQAPILWAIDLFESRPAQRKALAQAIHVLHSQLRAPIITYSALSLGGPDWFAPLTYPSAKELQGLGRSAVLHQLRKLQISALCKSKIDLVQSGSQREMSDALVHFAKRQQAGWIAVNSRRLQTAILPRLGAFADAVLAKSPVPVLTVNPNARAPKKIRRILYPADLTTESHFAFISTLKLAKALGAQLQLLHVEMPLETPFAYPEMSLGFYEAYLTEAEAARKRNNQEMLALYAQAAKQKKILTQCHVVAGGQSLAQAILGSARKLECDLICLASYRNESSPALLGGTVREIMSLARLPVLAFHC